MNDKRKTNKYAVTLDSSKCMSYTLDGIKYVANRSIFKNKEDLEKFYNAGVFLISEHHPKVEPLKAPPLKDVKGDDKDDQEDGNQGEDEKDSGSGDDQSLLPGDNNGSEEVNGQEEKSGDGEGRPSGIITSSSLTK